MSPTEQEVLKANQYQLGSWYRFLPSPTNEVQVKIIKLICDKFKNFDIIGMPFFNEE